MSKRSAPNIHSDSAPPPKKRKLNEIDNNNNNSNNNEIESSISPDEAPHGRFKPGQIVYEDNDFQFEFLYNDDQQNNLIALTGLKVMYYSPSNQYIYSFIHSFCYHTHTKIANFCSMLTSNGYTLCDSTCI